MEDKMTTTLQARNTSKFNLLAKQGRDHTAQKACLKKKKNTTLR